MMFWSCVLQEDHMQVRPFLEAFVEPEAFCFLACFHADRSQDLVFGHA